MAYVLHNCPFFGCICLTSCRIKGDLKLNAREKVSLRKQILSIFFFKSKFVFSAKCFDWTNEPCVDSRSFCSLFIWTRVQMRNWHILLEGRKDISVTRSEQNWLIHNCMCKFTFLFLTRKASKSLRRSKRRNVCLIFQKDAILRQMIYSALEELVRCFEPSYFQSICNRVF